MGEIKLLSDRLISQIAAGEVVERPASVVKELVENALDAGAGDVRVELEAGGKRRILVVDDGHGMGRDDALLAFDRHATSKISTFEDLSQVRSLGFRGEALNSIAAVARVELRTAAEPGDGHLVRVEGGRVLRAEPVAHPRGTRIEIASLFFNVPARRKFLKRPATELRRVLEVVQGYALARPDVRFSVLHQGRALLEALAVGEGEEGLRQRIHQVFGLDDELVPIPPGFGGPNERITGFLGNQETSRSRRTFVYVNQRLIRDRAIMASFYRAVREEWRSDDYPALFLVLDLPVQDVDVNVHPQKSEVRFRDPSFLDRVGAALRAALGDARGEEEAPLALPAALPSVPPVWEGLGGRGGLYSEEHSPGSLRRRHEGDWQPDGEASSLGPGYDRGQGTGSEIREPAPPYGGTIPRIAQPSMAPPEPRVIPLSGRSGEARPFRLLGQYKGSLILLEGPDGLYVIDQHVAHERLLYERLRRSLAEEEPVSQRLLEPLVLELAPTEAMRLAELAPALEGCGFELRELSGNSLALAAVPTVLDLEQAEALLLELATSDGEVEREATALARDLLDALASSLSCRGAVKIHHPLSPPAMEALVSELFAAEQPYACPHGRPVVLQMSDVELERRFGRR